MQQVISYADIEKEMEHTGAQRYCSYCSWQKGTFRTKVISNSEEIKLISLFIVKLC